MKTISVLVNICVRSMQLGTTVVHRKDLLYLSRSEEENLGLDL